MEDKKCPVLFLLLLYVMIQSTHAKTTLAVYDLKASNLLTSEEVLILTNHLTSLVTKSGQYDILDRSRMSEILQEQGFQQSGCTSDACAVQAGQLLGVQKMLTGSVGRFGKLFTIELRLVDVETGKIDLSATYYYQGEMEKLLTEGLQNSLDNLFSLPTVQERQPDQSIAKGGTLFITSSPDNVQIAINNKPYGNTPLKIDKLQQGNYSINATKQEYFDFDTTVIVKEFEQKEISLHLQTIHGTLTIFTTPKGASIFLNDEKFGTTPLENKIIRAGDYLFSIKKDGYSSNEIPVTIISGKNTIINRILEKVAQAEQPVPEEISTEETPEEAPEEVVEEKPIEEEVKETISKFKPGWTAKVYINGGPIEPWGDPGTGALFNTGIRIQGGTQLNIDKWIKLPLIFKPLTAEVMAGYGMWKIRDEINSGIYQDSKTNVISILVLGVMM